jgi:GTP:adenosylcobinamide-phosphate guanylyltransferase
MQLFIKKPSIDLFTGVRVDKDTKLEYNTENVQQTLENLALHSVQKVKGVGFESTYDTTIYLEEGDVLIYEADGRGYIKPVEQFVEVAEAMNDLACIKDMG